jgi:hypothetical protein
LYDSGLTMTEASQIIRSNVVLESTRQASVSSEHASNRTILDASATRASELHEEIARLRERVARLERQGRGAFAPVAPDPVWWETLRDEIDAS